ncbi:hypothetical protein D3C87_1535220 [compost metagenome]
MHAPQRVQQRRIPAAFPAGPYKADIADAAVRTQMKAEQGAVVARPGPSIRTQSLPYARLQQSGVALLAEERLQAVAGSGRRTGDFLQDKGVAQAGTAFFSDKSCALKHHLQRRFGREASPYRCRSAETDDVAGKQRWLPGDFRVPVQRGIQRLDRNVEIQQRRRSDRPRSVLGRQCRPHQFAQQHAKHHGVVPQPGSVLAHPVRSRNSALPRTSS